MLPAWATVTITLGGALITGLATGLVAVYGSRTTVKVARLQLDQTHRETWAAERLAACVGLAQAAAKVALRPLPPPVTCVPKGLRP